MPSRVSWPKSWLNIISSPYPSSILPAFSKALSPSTTRWTCYCRVRANANPDGCINSRILKRVCCMFFLFSVPSLVRTLLIAGIAVITLAGIMLRPFQWNEALIALAGAALLLVLGLLAPFDAIVTLFQQWNTFLFFLGIMSLSACAEEAGLFDWLAAQAARLARRRTALLYLNVFLLGSLISMILSNDATALILTPIVYVLVTRL